jgi:hypothetical protein
VKRRAEEWKLAICAARLPRLSGSHARKERRFELWRNLLNLTGGERELQHRRRTTMTLRTKEASVAMRWCVYP